MSIMERADKLAKSKGYLSIWSMPREGREKFIAQARMHPMSELGEPEKKWVETFSAISVLKKHFFEGSK